MLSNSMEICFPNQGGMEVYYDFFDDLVPGAVGNQSVPERKKNHAL